MYRPQKHPVMPLLTREQVVAMTPEKWAAVMKARDEAIAKEITDPIRFGWEPGMWKVCDALLGFNWHSEGSEEWEQREEWNLAMRRHLGFQKPVKTLLINGGNRAAKSEYAAKRVVLKLFQKNGGRAWCLHMKADMSIDYQMPIMNKYFPSEIRGKTIREAICYIAYKQATGFSENHFVLPNGSDCRFMNYSMERRAVEGGEVDIIWPDELCPLDWLETMEFRIATRDGVMIPTFTPVDGYTSTVKAFTDGSQIVKTAPGFLLPKDGGSIIAHKALGFETEREFQEAQLVGPASKPYDVDKWLTGEPWHPTVPEGREFESMPIVSRCLGGDSGTLDDSRAIVYFHSVNNPFGNPRAVMEKIAGKEAEEVRMRFYGLATKRISSLFDFDEKAHVIPHEHIPKTGLDIMICDPASARNFAIGWIRILPEEAIIIEEFPNRRPIPNYGDIGPWAIPSGVKLDGEKGPGQKSLGWGYRQYKEEIARLEGWQPMPAYTEGSDSNDRAAAVRKWVPGKSPDIRTQLRYMDSRFASAPKIENDRPVTILEEFSLWGLHFIPTPGNVETDGISKIQDLLFYDRNQPLDYFNKPRLRVSSRCQNTIFALKTYTGQEGQKSACKDFIDILRYFALLGIRGQTVEEMQHHDPGGYYA